MTTFVEILPLGPAGAISLSLSVGFLVRRRTRSKDCRESRWNCRTTISLGLKSADFTKAEEKIGFAVANLQNILSLLSKTEMQCVYLDVSRYYNCLHGVVTTEIRKDLEIARFKTTVEPLFTT